jgi:hypothetical protein
MGFVIGKSTPQREATMDDKNTSPKGDRKLSPSKGGRKLSPSKGGVNEEYQLQERPPPPPPIRATPEPRYSMRPKNMTEAMEFAKIIAASDLVPKEYRGKPGNCLVAMQMGDEVGLGPMQAIQGIAFIREGRPSLCGDTLLAVCQVHRDWEWIDEKVKDNVATCTVKRHGMEPTARTFSEADAKAAGLWNKQGPWTQYRNRMLQMRARSWALRDTFADALRGLHSTEEVRDIPPSPQDKKRTAPEDVVLPIVNDMRAAKTIVALAEIGERVQSIIDNDCASDEDIEMIRSAYRVHRTRILECKNYDKQN